MPQQALGGPWRKGGRNSAHVSNFQTQLSQDHLPVTVFHMVWFLMFNSFRCREAGRGWEESEESFGPTLLLQTEKLKLIEVKHRKPA